MAGSEPLRSSTSWVLRAVSQTRTSVPLVDAVATIVPWWLSARHANSPWCALIVTGELDITASVPARSCKPGTTIIYSALSVWVQSNKPVTNISTFLLYYRIILMDFFEGEIIFFFFYKIFIIIWICLKPFESVPFSCT